MPWWLNVLKPYSTEVKIFAASVESGKQVLKSLGEITMTLLIVGLLLWSGVHFIPSLAQPLKAKWQNALGENAYQGTFALVVVLSLVLIVLGWRGITPEHLYSLPDVTRPISVLMVLISFLLFGASHRPTRIKSFTRHPQLLGFFVWCCAHLLVNGDNRSVVLFGALAVWSIIEVLAINRRLGNCTSKNEIPSWPDELKGIAISVVVFVVVMLVHPYITGVSLR